MARPRWIVVGCMFLVTALGLRADDPVELTPEKRTELEKEADQLTARAGQLYQAREYSGAIELMQKVLSIRQQLFPKAQYPQGHPQLAMALHNLSLLLQEKGEYTKAEPLGRDALLMARQLYPPDKYPDGHPALISCLNNLATVYKSQGAYSKGEALLGEALQMCQKLFPRNKYPQGHPQLAMALNFLGTVREAEGDYPGAEPLFRESLEMRRSLYPKEKYPQGHPDIANSLNNLGAVFLAQGENTKATVYFRESLQMVRQLYPKDQYPQGHPILALALTNEGLALSRQNHFDKAESLYREALEMRRQLYPKEKFPHGHREIAQGLEHLGYVYLEKKEYATAEPLYREALSMTQELYPTEKYPRGQPELATSLNGLASVFLGQGEYAKAEPLCREVLDMRRALYPKEKYPQGHPSLADSLNRSGYLLMAQGKYADAEPIFQEAVRMRRAQFQRFADVASETEALNFAVSQGLTLDALLSTTRHLPKSTGIYPFVWEAKGTLARIQQRRHVDLLACGNEQSKAVGRDLIEVRQRLAHLLLSASREAGERAKEVQQLTEAKEALEKQLVRLLKFESLQTASSSPEQLRDRLPADTAFIDLVRYTDFQQDPAIPGKKGEIRTLRYVAFIVRPGQEVARVELGEAKAIEQAWAAWRTALTTGALDREAAIVLSRLVWQPLRASLPEKLATIWIAPDGELNRVPWAALPGARANSVLLEDHALAVVPSGEFLLQRVQGAPAVEGRTDKFLAVGGVAYDEPSPNLPRTSEELVLRGAAIGDQRLLWKPLEGTDRERSQILDLARKALKSEPLERKGSAASTTQLLSDLPQARYAHLATHGFFADARFRSALQVDESQFVQYGQDRIAPGARNPLVLSGLVLAGSNQPDHADRGILTAEAIVSLRLDDMDLAVLSACDTGLGEVAGGEGVFGLQRAFHIAGARNVVASLWKVDDEATAALMVLFYRHLWIEKKEPLKALREAQLYLYRHPEQITALAKTRGVDFTEKELPKVEADPAIKEPRSHPSKWAAFVLSGDGR